MKWLIIFCYRKWNFALKFVFRICSKSFFRDSMKKMWMNSKVDTLPVWRSKSRIPKNGWGLIGDLYFFTTHKTCWNGLRYLETKKVVFTIHLPIMTFSLFWNSPCDWCKYNVTILRNPLPQFRSVFSSFDDIMCFNIFLFSFYILLIRFEHIAWVSHGLLWLHNYIFKCYSTYIKEIIF